MSAQAIDNATFSSHPPALSLVGWRISHKNDIECAKARTPCPAPDFSPPRASQAGEPPSLSVPRRRKHAWPWRVAAILLGVGVVFGVLHAATLWARDGALKNAATQARSISGAVMAYLTWQSLLRLGVRLCV